MNKRSREILVLLTNLKQNLRISDLAEKFQVSERTIRNDINDINDYLGRQNITTIKLGSNGTLLVEDDIENAMILDTDNDFYNYRLSKEERKVLIAAILIQAPDHITLSNIAELLFVSRATIINDLEGVKKMLKKGNLNVISHSNKGLLLEGKESDKRTFLLRLLSSDDGGLGENSVVQSFIKGLDIEIQQNEDDKRKLQKLMNEQEHYHGRFLTDASFDYLMQYLLIAIERIKQGNTVTSSSGGQKSKYEMAKDIFKYIALYWNLEETEGEVELLSDILDSLSYIKKERRNQRIIGLQLVTRKFIENISADLEVDLNRDFDFYENLVNHLESIFTKSFNITQRDEFLSEIVNRNEKVQETVGRHVEMLERFVGRDITKMERDYIVIHICAALERRKKKEIDFQVVIVCNGGVGTSQLLMAKMKNRFDFHVVDVVSAHHLNKNHYRNIDMVISTIPLKEYDGDYILVTPMFSDEDYLRVNRKIEEIQKEQGSYQRQGESTKMKSRTATELLRILKPIVHDYGLMEEVTEKVMDFFGESYQQKIPALYELLPQENIQLGVECRDWKEAIKESAKPLLEKGFIEERYIDAMIHNVLENGTYIVISPGFALPHEGFDAGSKKVGMNLIRLKQPVVIEDIDGEEEIVRFFCCMSTVDHKKHMKAFFHLVNMLTNERFKEELKNASTSKETAEIIKKYEQRIKE